MKELLAILSLVWGVVCEPPAPYAPSGWRPDGPSLELPQRIPAAQNPNLFGVDPRNKTPIKQQYLPPDQQYGAPVNPEVDLSVQGLPQQEQVPIFQLSPINGQQYVGPNFNADIRNLDQSLKQSQVQNQQQTYRQFALQRQLEAAQSNNNPNRVTPVSPRQFGTRTTVKPQSTTPKTEERTTESTTELNLNEGETLDGTRSNDKKDKVTVEVTKQNIQEIPPELYLNPLAQLRLQPQLVPIQFGQIRAYPEKQTGYDAPAHFSALPSVLAQQQLAQQQIAQQQLTQQKLDQQQFTQQQLAQPQSIQQHLSQRQLSDQQVQRHLFQQQLAQQQLSQQQLAQPQGYPVQPQLIPQQTEQFIPQQGQRQEPVYVQVPQSTQSDQGQVFPLQPSNQFVQQGYQLQAQPVLLQPSPQSSQFDQGIPQYQTQSNQFDQQGYQVQPVLVQPGQEQPNSQPQLVYQYQTGYQPQNIQQQVMANQFYQPQASQQSQGQDNLQSGIDTDDERNDIDQPEEKEDDDGSTATAVATAFGTRTQPRVNTRYGAPVPRVQASPEYQTTEAQDEAVTENGQAVAEATAVARGSKRKSSKLRNRRVRPVFTLDKSGHLVLAQE